MIAVDAGLAGQSNALLGKFDEPLDELPPHGRTWGMGEDGTDSPFPQFDFESKRRQFADDKALSMAIETLLNQRNDVSETVRVLENSDGKGTLRQPPAPVRLIAGGDELDRERLRRFLEPRIEIAQPFQDYKRRRGHWVSTPFHPHFTLAAGAVLGKRGPAGNSGDASSLRVRLPVVCLLLSGNRGERFFQGTVQLAKHRVEPVVLLLRDTVRLGLRDDFDRSSTGFRRGTVGTGADRR